MPETEMEHRLTQVENRVANLEEIETSNNKKFEEIRLSLANIEKFMLGSVHDNSIGLIATIQNDKREISELRAALIKLQTSFDELLKEYARYKWWLKGSMATVCVLVGYIFKVWEIFGKPGI